MLPNCVIAYSNEPKKLSDLKDEVSDLQHHQWMKLISKDSPSKLKDPSACARHFHPSILFAAAPVTKKKDMYRACAIIYMPACRHFLFFFRHTL